MANIEIGHVDFDIMLDRNMRRSFEELAAFNNYKADLIINDKTRKAMVTAAQNLLVSAYAYMYHKLHVWYPAMEIGEGEKSYEESKSVSNDDASDQSGVPF